jgi:hypothetical protein
VLAFVAAGALAVFEKNVAAKVGIVKKRAAAIRPS